MSKAINHDCRIYAVSIGKVVPKYIYKIFFCDFSSLAVVSNTFGCELYLF